MIYEVFLDRYERVKRLFGEDDFEKIAKAKILLLGVGGVGSYALDCLYRTGVEDITIVDFDTYDLSNQNRQMGSDNSVGKVKVHRLKELYPNITPLHEKITVEWVESFDFSPYDLILDAIDDIKPKVALMKQEYKKLIVSAGSARKTDPTKIEIASIWKTYNDPFSRRIREELKKQRFSKNVATIFSSQMAITKAKGSFVGVTGSFGLAMCSYTIDKILNKGKK